MGCRKALAMAGAAVAAMVMTAGPAVVTHPHHPETPGSCVDRNGAGFGTGQPHMDNSADPGDTTFHERSHKGKPGTFAFERENDPVSVLGGLCSHS